MINYLITFIYLAAVLFIGYLAGKKNRQSKEMFNAGRSIGWVPVGLSVLVTSFSSINVMAFPLEVFKNGLAVFDCFISMNYKR